jgi:hypothetical protein
LSGITADKNVVGIGKGDNPHLVLSVAARQLGNQSMFNDSIINLESGTQLVGSSKGYKTLDDGIKTMEDLVRELTGVSADYHFPLVRDPQPAASGGNGQSSGGFSILVLGYGAMNLALGLGSFIQGDWGGGLTLLAGYGAAAGLIVRELSLNYEDKLAGIPGAGGLVTMGLTALYGFIRPFLYRRSQRLAVIVDGINLAVVPENRNRTAVLLSYTIRF